MKVSTSQKRIVELMNMLDISQTVLARRTGLGKSTISMYVNGQREPKQDSIALISNAFNIDPAWLMGYDVSMEVKTKEDEDAEKIGKLILKNPSRALEILDLIIDMPDDQYKALISFIKASKKE